jgi:hypothetical protein
MNGEYVRLVHPELGEQDFVPSTVRFWQSRGWQLPSDAAGSSRGGGGGDPSEQGTRDTAPMMNSEASEPGEET